MGSRLMRPAGAGMSRRFGGTTPESRRPENHRKITGGPVRAPGSMAVNAPTTMRTNDAGGHPPAFSHEAVLYRGDSDFLSGTLPFVRAGIDNDEAILVVVEDRKIATMREALGSDADKVEFA